MKRILNRITPPPGALHPRAQTWLLAGLSIAIAITLLTFPGSPASPGGSGAQAAGASEPAGTLGEESIESAGERMRADAARRAERRLQEELGLTPPRADGLPQAPAPLAPASGSYGTAQPSIEEEIAREERLRRYRSLRAPSVVQSRRGEAAPSVPAAAPPADPASGMDGEPVRKPAQPAADESEAPEEPTHTLYEGEFLEAVLTNRLAGDFTGPVSAMVSADAYDRSRQRLLVPRGSRAVGTARRVEDWDQARLAVLFRRLILPDGSSVSLDQSPALNQVGEAGLKDVVNRRYASAIGAAGAVGALAGLTQAASPRSLYDSRFGAARLGAGSGLAGAAERMLDRYLNRLPRITIREGHRLRIHLTADLALPAYRRPTALAGKGGRP